MAFLPDYPATTKWLTEAEKVVAQGRLAADAGSEDALGEENVSIWRGISQAIKDVRVWLFACMQMATTASISYSHFFPTLIQQIGFKNRTTVLLLTSPPYLFAFVWALSFAVVADRKQNRSISSGISAIVAMLVSKPASAKCASCQPMEGILLGWWRQAQCPVLTASTYTNSSFLP